ncbi:MAG: transglutaminase-like cysteine peptidase [Rhizobiales bacterium]|nr:transglutaminase-like cysteine peptidase [Hyphomicrobiales bacterium]
MSFVRVSSCIAGLAMFFGLIAGAAAQDHPAFMRVTGKTSQPVGHFELCSRMPVECNEITRNTAPVHLTVTRWNELIAVNDNVNTAIEPVTDQELYGREEYWNYPEDGKGDCEDFVLLKRRELIEKGWPAGSKIKLWGDTEYQFVKRQSDQNSGRWVSIDDDRPTLVGSIKR